LPLFTSRRTIVKHFTGAWDQRMLKLIPPAWAAIYLVLAGRAYDRYTRETHRWI
jgi:hypothetical protein